jgi:hypothetical protein
MEFYLDNQFDIDQLKNKTREFAIKNLDWKVNASNLSSYFLEMKNNSVDDTIIAKAKFFDIKLMKFGFLYSVSPIFYKLLVKNYKKFFKK